MTTNMDFKGLNSKSIYHGRVFNLRQDQVRLPNGQTVDLDIVEHPGAVVLVPLDDENHLWFVRQYRHAAATVLLELPAGTIEPGEDLEICALRELREEIGMAADRIQKIGEFYMAPGYSTEYLTIFLATDLRSDPLPTDEDEFLQVERIPVDQAYSLAEGGQLRDAKSLAALILARPYI
jgi:ADP-ribose pyrophosphatase